MNYITFWVVKVNEEGEILERLFTGSRSKAIEFYNKRVKNKQNIAIYEMECHFRDSIGCGKE